MIGGLLAMSMQEVERVTVIKQVVDKRLKQSAAARLLKITVRQIKRLVRVYREHGAEGLISKRRGKPGPNQHSSKLKMQTKVLVQKHYYDFGPTFASEKLLEDHKIDVNKETLRQWMMEWELWKAKRHKKVIVHQSRERRSCFGELVQIDGSPHNWFERRAAESEYCLLVAIDDATGKLLALRFEKEETTMGYFKLTRTYLEKHGRPLAFYSDKYGVFRVNTKDCEDHETQFGRAMRELNIELICAHSPQAKGRVERVNQTLQDRLVKEMRLRNICSIDEANAYLPEFIDDFNQRFAVEPKSEINAHRQDLPTQKQLDLIFTTRITRTLSKNLELCHNNVIYKVQTNKPGYGLRHAKVSVCEDLSGNMFLLYKGRILNHTCLPKQKRAPKIIDAKQLNDEIEKVRIYAPAPANHPWRGKFRITETMATV